MVHERGHWNLLHSKLPQQYRPALRNRIQNPTTVNLYPIKEAAVVLNYASLSRPVGSTHSSLPERVTAELRVAIRERRMKPGDRLVEERLAQDLGVSRNPVREAIRRLATEGLVVITARRGAVVAGVTTQEAREIVEVRALLEGHNARLAARRKNQVVLKQIAGVLDRGTKAAALGQYDKLPALNASFHQALAMAGENEVLGEMLQRLRERTEMFFDPIEGGRQQAQWADHAAILRAILDGDESRAAMLAAEHVIRAGARSAGQDHADIEPHIPVVE